MNTARGGVSSTE
jgi:hypothetical protein